MSAAADGHDTRAIRRKEAVEQKTGQREVPEMIGAELHLEAIDGAPIRNRHQARIIAEKVQPFVRDSERLGKASNRGQIGQVEEHRFHRCTGRVRLSAPQRRGPCQDRGCR